MYITLISPNSIYARKYECRFEVQQTYHKIYSTGWGLENHVGYSTVTDLTKTTIMY